MHTKWVVLGQDLRMKKLAQALTKEDHTVLYKYTDTWDKTLYDECYDFEPHYIILPIQPLKLEYQQLEGLQVRQFFVGKTTKDWDTLLKNKIYSPYLQNEQFIWKNAGLTAEALIIHLFLNGYSIKGKNVLITGFGRVAKMAALLLTQMKANVTIAVRSENQLAEAIAFNYSGRLLRPELRENVDIMINTIPAKWLDESFQQIVDCKIFDVASYPGCLNGVTDYNYELLPALPGKYLVDDAAATLYEAIWSLKEEREKC